MRIVLTNAGKKEIIIDETDKLPYKNLHSEEKIKYNPKFTMPSKKRRSLKYQINKFSDINEKNKSAKRLLTEGPLSYQNKILKKSSTLKVQKTLEFNENSNDNIKFINIKSHRKNISKELNNIYSIKENDETNFEDEKYKDQIGIKYFNNNISLPIIKKSVILKDILMDKNSKNINKKILQKEISKNENNLINYLKLDKTIKPSFIEKLNKADNDRLIKLDKICQKYFNDKKRNDLLQQNIQEKIKLEYSNDSKYCRENLINLQKNIQDYKKIYKSYLKSYRSKHYK